MDGGRLRSMVRELSPGYFALVMATGIVSVGLADDGRRLLSRCLLGLTVAAFAGLIFLNLWRLVSYRAELVADLTDPAIGFGFYTFVAGADVLAARIATSWTEVALVLMVVAAASWLLRGYAVPWTTRLGEPGRPLLASADGTWFLWAVGAQSVAVAAAVLCAVRPGPALPALAVGAWCVGAVLYALTGVIVTGRVLVLGVGAGDLTPPTWIAMGAAAITALAGAEISLLPHGPFLDASIHLVRGGSLLAWVLATWLIPALVAAGWWRHVTHRVPLAYDRHLWSMVFPLGMYAVASMRLGSADGFSLLDTVGRAWIWVAFVVWAVTFAAGAVHVVRRAVGR